MDLTFGGLGRGRRGGGGANVRKTSFVECALGNVSSGLLCRYVRRGCVAFSNRVKCFRTKGRGAPRKKIIGRKRGRK